MNNIVLVIVLLGGCLLMHWLMMRKGGHDGSHEDNVKNQDKDEKKDKHDGSCCH